MPPLVALTIWFILLVALLYFDPARGPKSSIALWVPVIWLFILGSRTPSQWLSGHISMSTAGVQEGSPVDQAITLILIALAVVILTRRSFNWGSFVTRNLALTAFVLFALISVFWSDFPFIGAKRWFRDLGAYFAILVVLSDPRPMEAIRTVLRRLAYLLIPLSIVLDKYFPELSRSFDPWTGVGYYQGVTTSKNMLGLACLVSGLFFFWDIVERWHERKERRTRQILLLDAVFLVLTIKLLQSAQSTTSKVCMVLGCLVILAGHTRVFRRHPALLKTLVPASFGLYLLLDFGFGLNGSMARAVGRDPTLTDRTKIWSFLIGMHTNPLVGTGYQSFWLGPRLDWFWSNAKLGHINEAHNGYLEVYLELGLIGVFLLAAFLIASYRTIWKRARTTPSLTVFGLALWMVVLFYNMSEAAFEGGLLYLVFLMGAISLPERAKKRVMNAVEPAHLKSAVREPILAMESQSLGEHGGYAHKVS